MATGEPFDWNDESMRSRMFVASARDPRFAKTLIYNGATFKGQPVQSYVGGRNGRPLDGATPTSYYLRKHIVEATSFVTGSEMSYQHIFPFFRYAEVLLNYAEALAAATQNPDFTGMKGEVEYTLSPREALNAVRARYNMPGITETDYAAFVKRLRNERRWNWLSRGIVSGTSAAGRSVPKRRRFMGLRLPRRTMARSAMCGR